MATEKKHQHGAVPADPSCPASCFMCQIDAALRRQEPEAVPAHVATAADAESALTTLMCCGTSSYLAWRYRGTRVVRRFFAWMLAAYFLLFLFCVATVCLL